MQFAVFSLVDCVWEKSKPLYTLQTVSDFNRILDQQCDAIFVHADLGVQSYGNDLGSKRSEIKVPGRESIKVNAYCVTFAVNWHSLDDATICCHYAP